jgi:hypothetical protein
VRDDVRVACHPEIRYRILDAMGIQQWLPRNSGRCVLVSDKPIFSAACLVLLPQNPSLHLEQKKILIGMLNVLALDAEELCITWVHDSVRRDQIYKIGQEIAKWAPYSVLMMGESLVQQVLETEDALDELRLIFQRIPGLKSMIQVTYHPEVLLEFKELKSKAYRDLLNLRDHISKVRCE